MSDNKDLLNRPHPQSKRRLEETLSSDTTIERRNTSLIGLFYNEEINLGFSGVPVSALAKARTKGKLNPITQSLHVGDTIIKLGKALRKPGAGETKLLRYGASALTKINPRYAKNPTLRISGDTKAYARDNGIQIDPRQMSTPQEQAKEDRRAAKALENFVTKLRNSAIILRDEATFDFTTAKGKQKRYSGLAILGGYNIDADVLELEFTLSAAEYFVQQPLSIIPRAFYAIDEHKPNAIAIADELIRQYSTENNVLRQTEDILKVETLLSYTSLPTIDDLKGKGGKNKAGETVERSYSYRWIDRIKEPFEEAMEELVSKGLLRDWNYCLSHKVPIPDNEPIERYEQFISLSVHFVMNGAETHKARAERIVTKRKEIKEKAATKRKRQKEEKGKN